MKEKIDDEELMTRYLLGELSEEERVRLEEQFFTDEEYYERLLAREDELTYDYAQGDLSPRERGRFEERFLASAEGRRKAGFARALIEKASEFKAAGAREASRPEQSPRRPSLSALFGFRRPALGFSLAAAALVVALGAAWLMLETKRLRDQLAEQRAERAAQERRSQQEAADERARLDQLRGELEGERERRARLERELAERRAQPAREGSAGGQAPPGREPAGVRARPFVISFVLTPGQVRGADELKRLRIPAGADRLRLQLVLKGEGGYKSYRAVLRTAEGEEVWSRAGLRARAGESGRALSLSLPARLLAADDYELTLSGLTAGGDLEEVGDYYFGVVKR
jgi:hypothetical protein